MAAYSQESEDSTLVLNEQESKPSGKLKLTITVEKFSPSGFHLRCASTIYETADSATLNELTSSAADSLAKIFQTLEREQG